MIRICWGSRRVWGEDGSSSARSGASEQTICESNHKLGLRRGTLVALRATALCPVTSSIRFRRGSACGRRRSRIRVPAGPSSAQGLFRLVAPWRRPRRLGGGGSAQAHQHRGGGRVVVGPGSSGRGNRRAGPPDCGCWPDGVRQLPVRSGELSRPVEPDRAADCRRTAQWSGLDDRDRSGLRGGGRIQ